MRRGLVLVGALLFSFGLLHCVSDEPPTTDATDSGASGDGTSGGDAAQADSGGDAAAPDDLCTGHPDCPNQIQNAHLQLWLRGNVGLSCSGGRIASWSDQSGHGNDTAPAKNVTGALKSNQLTPQCGVATIAGHEVASFTAPSVDDAGPDTNYVTETLAVSMEWIVNTDYTVIVVHRRQLDGQFGLLAQDRNAIDGCILSAGKEHPQEAFDLGFAALGDGGNGAGYTQYCGSFLGGNSGYDLTDTFSPAQTEVDEVVFSTSTGHQVYVNGAHVVAGAGQPNDIFAIAPSSLDDAGLPGVIGRGSDAVGVDTRYQGDIAEIIGYDAALSDDDRTKVEAYLKRQWGLTF